MKKCFNEYTNNLWNLKGTFMNWFVGLNKAVFSF